MKKIGQEIGVNESRVSQLHARAVQRLRKILGPDLKPEQVVTAMTAAALKKQPKRVLKMAKARLSPRRGQAAEVVAVAG